ncbi:MAG TPA: MFS transporter [Planctomycetaceae bacterium]|nr:MFS transporter [Planctomycetaceae bacterium]
MSVHAVLEEDSTLAVAAAPPRRRMFYGWVMLPIAMTGLIATAPGQTFGISVFTEEIRGSLGLSHSRLAAAYMLGSLLAALPITYVGLLMDRFGLRAMLAAATVLFGGACLAMSQVAGWASLLAVFFLLRLLGPGSLSFLSGNTLAFWFHRRLGMVEGIRHVGMAAAIGVVPGVHLWLMHSLGWRGAYVALGVGVWAVMLPLILFLFRNRPEDVGQSLDGLPPDLERATQEAGFSGMDSFTLGEALRTGAFWSVVAGSALFGLIHTGVFFSLVPIFQSRGLSDADAVGAISSFAVSLAAMHLIGGFLSDRWPERFLLALGLVLLALGMLLLCRMNAAWIGHAGGVAMGLGQGLYFGASHPLWARYFGRLHLGKIRGVLMTSNVAASSLGPLLIGLSRDAFGNYELILVGFMLLPLPVAACALSATAPKKLRRLGDDSE